MKLEQGQAVVLIPGSYGRHLPYEVTVSRVARKYAYVEIGSVEVGFDLETGREKGDKYVTGRSIRTVEFHARVQRRHRAEQRLSELGIKPKDSSRFAYSVETLEAIIDLLEHDSAGPVV